MVMPRQCNGRYAAHSHTCHGFSGAAAEHVTALIFSGACVELARALLSRPHVRCKPPAAATWVIQSNCIEPSTNLTHDIPAGIIGLASLKSSVGSPAAANPTSGELEWCVGACELESRARHGYSISGNCTPVVEIEPQPVRVLLGSARARGRAGSHAGLRSHRANSGGREKRRSAPAQYSGRSAVVQVAHALRIIGLRRREQPPLSPAAPPGRQNA